MPATPLALLGFGFLLGARHALEVDHLVAVSTLVSQRRGVFRSSWVGVLWGLGHTAALLAAASGVMALRAQIPARLAQGLELAVALMLVALGVNLLHTLWAGGTLHHHAHAHDDHIHAHPHVHEHAHADGPAAAQHHHGIRGAELAPQGASARRPFLVGVVHGLAGSAGLMLASVAGVSHSGLALAYVAVFGAGSVVGMAILSGLLGLPFAGVGERFRRAQLALGTCAALGSVAVGLALVGEIALRSGPAS